MTVNNKFYDYGNAIYELEEVFGKEVEDGDYFIFFEKCEDELGFKDFKSDEELEVNLIRTYGKLGKTPKERSENIWYIGE